MIFTIIFTTFSCTLVVVVFKPSRRVVGVGVVVVVVVANKIAQNSNFLFSPSQLFNGAGCPNRPK